jgi:hypothetical protein
LQFYLEQPGYFCGGWLEAHVLGTDGALKCTQSPHLSQPETVSVNPMRPATCNHLKSIDRSPKDRLPKLPPADGSPRFATDKAKLR